MWNRSNTKEKYRKWQQTASANLNNLHLLIFKYTCKKSRHTNRFSVSRSSINPRCSITQTVTTSGTKCSNQNLISHICKVCSGFSSSCRWKKWDWERHRKQAQNGTEAKTKHLSCGSKTQAVPSKQISRDKNSQSYTFLRALNASWTDLQTFLLEGED